MCTCTCLVQCTAQNSYTSEAYLLLVMHYTNLITHYTANIIVSNFIFPTFYSCSYYHIHPNCFPRSLQSNAPITKFYFNYFFMLSSPNSKGELSFFGFFNRATCNTCFIVLLCSPCVFHPCNTKSNQY